MLRYKSLKCVVLISFILPTLLACPKSTNTEGYETKIVFANPAGVPVAKVGDVVLTNQSIEEHLASKGATLISNFNTDPLKKREFVENQIRQEILFQEAIRRGYLNDPKIQKEIKMLLVGRLSKEEAKKFESLNQVSEDELLKYYEEKSELFHQPEKVRVSYLFIPFGEAPKEAQKTAKEAHKKAMDPIAQSDRRHFEKLIAEYTKTSNEKSDEMPNRPLFMSKAESSEKFGENIANALWAMDEKTTLSPVIEGKDGYYIFKRLSKRPPIDRDFESAKANIEKRLVLEKRREAFTKMIDDLKKEYNVAINEEHLATLQLSKP